MVKSNFEHSNLYVAGWMDGWVGMGYLQTGPFLDHLAVIKRRHNHKILASPGFLLKSRLDSARIFTKMSLVEELVTLEIARNNRKMPIAELIFI